MHFPMELLRNLFRSVMRLCRYSHWLLLGRPSGSVYPFFKQRLILATGRQYACSTLVETGTLTGDTIAATRNKFYRVLSVELSQDLYRRALLRFRRARNVFLWQGDSAAMLPHMLAAIEGRAVFWLDAHYIGTVKGEKYCAVLEELAAIAGHSRKDHCILIDDARLFGVVTDYPAIDKVRQYLLAINPSYIISVEHDMIVALPPAG